MSKGFSLVELTIVLVLIGVLISGAIRGVQFIELARAKKVISDASLLIDAQNRFREREKRYAGDVNNDGMIDFGTLTVATLDDTGTDADTAFTELKGFGLLPTDLGNDLIAETQETGTMHFAGTTVTVASNVTVLNMVVISNVPCIAAFQLEQNIDKDRPDTTDSAGTGQIRMISAAGALSSSGAWTSVDSSCVVGGVVSDDALTNVSYIF